MQHPSRLSSIPLSLALTLFAFSAPAWNWTGVEKTDIKTAQNARDAKSPAAIDFLVTGFTNAYEGVAIRCIDYVKRMVMEDGVTYDREKLCALAAGQIPGGTRKLTDKLCYFMSDLGPGDNGRKKLEQLLLGDDLNNAHIAIRCLIGVKASADFMANVRDAMASVHGKPAGDRNSLIVIQKAASEKHQNDEGFQLYAIRAIGILGNDSDVSMLKEVLDPAKTQSLAGKYPIDRVVYALRACPRFPDGRELITPYLTHSEKKIKKEAQKALEEWSKKNPGK